MTTALPPHPAVGALLREWRERRRMSQLDLALDAGISTRHLSFVETGRSVPSREMVLHLSAQLDLPLRERNHLLLAAGYAPVYAETPLDQPQLATVRAAVRQVLRGHEPYPGVVVDQAWNVVEANAGMAVLTAGAARDLLTPPVNALRVALHPQGMAPRIVNLGEWRAHLLGRLRRRVARTADPELTRLLAELRAYPCDQPEPEVELPGPGAVFVPLRLRHGAQELSFFSTLATFGTPLDITVAELAIESFFPGDPATAAVLASGRAGPASANGRATYEQAR
jgi:transcriptional regulator with XRE-family HTH domain